MKITQTLGCVLFLLVVGCSKHDAPPVQSQSLPVVSKQTTVSEWDKVKIDNSGEIFVNKKQVTLTEFTTECQRLKNVGGAAVLYIDSQNRPLNPAQTEAFHKLVDAGVPMKAVQKEGELD
jgi:biopolymer transport protein ExbD